MLTMNELEVWVADFRDMAIDQVQGLLLVAANHIVEEDYAVAATCFLAVLALPVLTLPIGLYARYHGAKCLVQALIAGQYDDLAEELSSLSQANTVLDQAEALLLDFIQLAPNMDHASVYLQLAMVQRMQARYAVALDSLQAALTFEKNSAILHFEYAQTCEILGLTEKAKIHFHQAYEYAKDNDMIARRYCLFLKQHGEAGLAKVILAHLQIKAMS